MDKSKMIPTGFYFYDTFNSTPMNNHKDILSRGNNTF